MALRIQTNIAAMEAQRNLGVSQSALNKSLQRLSSGYRINSASDDAAGLATSNQFQADIASYLVAGQNTSQANSLLQVASGGMSQIGNILNRLKELATQAASANAGTNRDKIDAEKTQLMNEIDRIANSTAYAGQNLLDGSFGDVSSTWQSTGILTTNKIVDANTGRSYTFAQSAATTPTLSFTFDNTPALTAQAYTLTTDGTAQGMNLVGTDGSKYIGSMSGTTLTFSDIGLTIVGASTLTTAAANIAADTITVGADTGLRSTSMSVSSSTTAGTWTITDAAGTVTLTNGSTSQHIDNVSGGAQTLDFDQLGIKINLGSGYTAADLNGLNFDVANTGSSSFQVGAQNTVNDRISISVGDVTTTATGLNLTGLDLSTVTGAQSALDAIDSAINTLSSQQGAIGAAQNRLGYASANLDTTIQNYQAANSVIRDVDMAAEMTNFTKNQILSQAGTAMLAQANTAPQSVLTLLK